MREVTGRETSPPLLPLLFGLSEWIRSRLISSHFLPPFTALFTGDWVKSVGKFLVHRNRLKEEKKFLPLASLFLAGWDRYRAHPYTLCPIRGRSWRGSINPDPFIKNITKQQLKKAHFFNASLIRTIFSIKKLIVFIRWGLLLSKV